MMYGIKKSLLSKYIIESLPIIREIGSGYSQTKERYCMSLEISPVLVLSQKVHNLVECPVVLVVQ